MNWDKIWLWAGAFYMHVMNEIPNLTSDMIIASVVDGTFFVELAKLALSFFMVRLAVLAPVNLTEEVK